MPKKFDRCVRKVKKSLKRAGQTWPSFTIKDMILRQLLNVFGFLYGLSAADRASKISAIAMIRSGKERSLPVRQRG